MPKGLPGPGLSPPAPRSRGGSGSGGGGGGPPGPPNRPRMRPQDVALGILTFAGVVGTAATVLGALLHVDAFGHLHWSARDCALGVALAAPVAALDLLILLPEHRDGEAGLLQRLEAAAEAKLARLEAQIREREELARLLGGDEGAAEGDALGGSGGGGVSTSSSGGGGGGNDGLGKAAAAAAEPATAASRAAEEAAADARRAAQRQATAAASPSPPSPTTPGWVSARLRNALFLAQGRLATANPVAAAGLPPAAEAAVVGAECLASEMLWRAVLLQSGGAWLSDRMFEAGADDVLRLGPYLLSTRDAGVCLAAAAVVTLSAAAAAQRVQRVGRGTLAQELRGMAAQLKQRRAQKQEDGGGRSVGAAASGGVRDEQQEQQQQQRGGGGGGGFLSDGLIPTTLSALRDGEAVTATRSVATTAALSLAFAATGNLAASLAASLANAAVFSAASRARLKRVRADQAAADAQLAALKRLAARYQREGARVEGLAREAARRGLRVPGDGDNDGGGGGSGGGGGDADADGGADGNTAGAAAPSEAAAEAGGDKADTLSLLDALLTGQQTLPPAPQQKQKQQQGGGDGDV